MASRSMSPGGALLRASRVFAIPNPLPRPTGDLSSQATFNSDTATLPYPIHQSITTPPSSLSKGDWGFKRPLPLRATTRTSTPIIRVEAIDTFEHVTEFGSAADHTLTLQKWHEMNIPLSTPTNKPKKASGSLGLLAPRKSVFENDIDSTAPVDGRSSGNNDTRWKFKGPWLAGLTEGDFQQYVSKEIGKRKSEFREYLREAYADQLTKEALEASLNASTEGKEDADADGSSEPVKFSKSDITEEQLTAYIKHLRWNDLELKQKVRTFLDLPPSAPASIKAEEMGNVMDRIHTSDTPKPNDKVTTGPISMSPYAASGPPKTHPSAGLSYGLTSSWTFNHPLFGPQKHHPPIQARVIRPKEALGVKVPQIGLGGIVADPPDDIDSPMFDHRPRGTRYRGNDPGPIPGLVNIDPSLYGGGKGWVSITHASIDPKGRVVLSATQADAVATAVEERRTDEIPEPLQRPMAASRGYSRPININPQTQSSSGANYGLI